jgi:hypothetical protein
VKSVEVELRRCRGYHALVMFDGFKQYTGTFGVANKPRGDVKVEFS